MKNNHQEDCWDLIIIGSGISALAAAWALAQRGKKILLCERHSKGGGMAHEFSRPVPQSSARYFFSAGVHYLGQIQKGAFTWRLFNWLTGNKLQWDYLPGHYDIFHFPGLQAQAHQNLKIYAQELSAQFPQEAKSIQRYFRQQPWAALGVVIFQGVNRFPLFWRIPLHWCIKRIFAVSFLTTQQYLTKNFRDQRLQAILAAQWGDYGAIPSVSMFGYSSLVSQHFQQGIGHPRGGSGQIFALVAPRLEKLGVEIRLGCPVEQILVEKQKAVGIVYRRASNNVSQTAWGKKILSTVGIFNTYYRLLPQNLLTPSIHHELKKLTPAPTAVILYLGARAPWAQCLPGHTGANHWLFPQLDHQVSLENYPIGEGVLFLAFTDGGEEREGQRAPTAQVIAFCGGQSMQEFAPWKANPATRKADPAYQQLKQQISERIIRRLGEKFPDLPASIAFQELATPFSFDKYQNAYQGAFYGVLGDRAKLHSPLTTSQTFVKDLYLGGQDLLSPGIVGALMGGLQAAGQILGPLGLWRIFRRIFSS